MKTKIIDIGNSKGITAPKREGWEESFKEMNENGDDILIMPDVFNDEIIPDWTWNNH